MMPPETSINLDPHDERVPEYQAVFRSETKREYPRPVYTVQNQGAEYITRSGCSRFGIAHLVNAQNSVRAQITRTSAPTEVLGKDLWLEYLEENPAAEADGATLLSALDQAKARGLITERLIVRTIQDAKSAIDVARFIYTGSLDGDWGKVRREHMYDRIPGKSNGHVFLIDDYDDRGFIAMNSYGEGNGRFVIPYKYWDLLYTRYAVVDSRDEQAITIYYSTIMDRINIEDAKLAAEAGIWNGDRPTDAPTREEVAAIVWRMGHR